VGAGTAAASIFFAFERSASKNYRRWNTRPTRPTKEAKSPSPYRRVAFYPNFSAIILIAMVVLTFLLLLPQR